MHVFIWHSEDHPELSHRFKFTLAIFCCDTPNSPSSGDLHLQNLQLFTRTCGSWLAGCRNALRCLSNFPFLFMCSRVHLPQTRRGCPPTWASSPALNVQGSTGSWESTTPGSSPSLWMYSAPQSSWYITFVFLQQFHNIMLLFCCCFYFFLSVGLYGDLYAA